MAKHKTFYQELGEMGVRPTTVSRWTAGIVIVLNLAALAISVRATFVPLTNDGAWLSDPFRLFPFLLIAIVAISMTPFARAIMFNNQAATEVGIDEFERAFALGVIGKAYRTTGFLVTCLLTAMMFAEVVSDLRLNDVSAKYWLMSLTLLFFSLPTIFAVFTAPRAADPEEE